MARMMRGIPNKLNCRERRAHFHYEHDWVLDHDSWIELTDRINDGSGQNRSVR
jgi:hypothetical protein